MAKIRASLQVLANSITGSLITANAIVGSHISPSVIVSSHISAGAVGSAAIAGTCIVNAHIANNAAIHYSKLDLSGKIQASDLASGVEGDAFNFATITGSTDGTNKVFTVNVAPYGYKLIPFVNNIKAMRVTSTGNNTGIDTFYMAASDATVFTLGEAPVTGDTVEAWVFN